MDYLICNSLSVDKSGEVKWFLRLPTLKTIAELTNEFCSPPFTVNGYSFSFLLIISLGEEFTAKVELYAKPASDTVSFQDFVISTGALCGIFANFYGIFAYEHDITHSKSNTLPITQLQVREDSVKVMSIGSIWMLRLPLTIEINLAFWNTDFPVPGETGRRNGAESEQGNDELKENDDELELGNDELKENDEELEQGDDEWDLSDAESWPYNLRLALGNVDMVRNDVKEPLKRLEQNVAVVSDKNGDESEYNYEVDGKNKEEAKANHGCDSGADNSASLIASLKAMFFDQKHTDFTIKVGGKNFPVHKCILSARSPVFEAMLQQDMLENATSALEIVDFDPNVIEILLLFLYTGQWDEESEAEALQLYQAAHKYDICDLKETCVKYLSRSVNLQNVCQILSVADACHDDVLRNVAERFIHQNIVEVQDTPEWEALVLEKPNLVFEMYRNITKKLSNHDI